MHDWSVTMELGIETNLEVVPKIFIRGTTLEFVMDLPLKIPKNWMCNLTDTDCGLVAKLHRAEHAGAGGLIGDLNPTWETGTDFTRLRFGPILAATTADWPLGLAEFDVVFTRTKAAVTKVYRSVPVQFTIVDGVTE
jgi:hypothetical protein